jgi:hypothetical protein
MSARELLAAAIEYAADGYAVFPCGAGLERKVPLIEHGLLEAARDPGQIEVWWTRWPRANIGVATGAVSGNLVVVDIDPRHDGLRSLVSQQAKLGELPPTRIVRTQSGGLHYWLRASTEIRNSASKLADGIDIRGSGGYVIAPPSINGKSGWVWESDDPVAQIPEAWQAKLVELATEPPRPNGQAASGDAPRWLAAACGTVAEGARNDTLTRVIGHLLRRFVEPRLVEALAYAFNAAHCVRPLDEAEVHRIVNSVAGRELKRRARRG